VLLFVLGACESGPGADPLALPLAPGYREVFRSTGPSEVFVDFEQRREALVVADVSASAGRLVIAGVYIRATSSTGFTTGNDPSQAYGVYAASGDRRLYLSDDDGVSWTQRTLAAATPFDEPTFPSEIGVAEHGGRAILQVQQSVGDAGGLATRLADLDLATGRFALRDDVATGPSARFEHRGPRIGYAFDPCERGGPCAMILYLHDLATGSSVRASTLEHWQVADDACVPQRALFDGDHAFFGACTSREGRTCLMRYDMERAVDRDGALFVDGEAVVCQVRPEGELPIPNLSTPPEQLFLAEPSHVLVRAFERDGHVLVSTLPGSGVRDLGEGVIAVGGSAMHFSFGGMLAIASPTERGVPNRFYRFSPDGTPVPVALPTSPCTDATVCARRWLMAVRELSAGRLLMVWDVRTGERQYVVAGVIDDPSYVPPPPPPDRRPGAASELEARCMMQAWCLGDRYSTPAIYHACVHAWLRSDPDALARFVASPMDCAALAARDPDAAPRFDPTCVSSGLERCDGARATRCVGLQAVTMDCAALHGGACTADASGRPSCLVPGAACPGPSHCDALGRAVDCEHGYVDDCTARGASCAMTYGETPRAVCEVLPPEENDCYCEDCADGGSPSDWNRAHCDSNLAGETRGYDCFGGRAIRRLDCARIGMACTSLPTAEPTAERPLPPDFGETAGSTESECVDPAADGLWCTGATPSCDGDVLVHCTEAMQRRLDCARYGMRCQPGTSGEWARCVR
jgi:hypothetical protein